MHLASLSSLTNLKWLHTALRFALFIAESEYLVHTISVQCLLLDGTTLDSVVRSTAMRRTPPNASERFRTSPKLHRMFGDDVSPLRCRQNYLDKLPIFHLVIVAIKLLLKNVSFYLITYFTFLLFLMSLFFAAFYDVFLSRCW